MKVVVHVGEVWLKGRNRPFFLHKLARNIRTALRLAGVEAQAFERQHGRFLLTVAPAQAAAVEAALEKVFGVKNFALVEEVPTDEAAIVEKASALLDRVREEGARTVGLSTGRSDKRLPFTSLDVNKKIGAEANRRGLRINFAAPDRRIYVEITTGATYLYTEKIPGLGGLPVSSSGRVLALLSGGIDSAVAAWLLMKRGCRVDFLHFHAQRTNEEVLETKIRRLVERLNDYQYGCRLFLVPYSIYQVYSMGKVPERLDLVAFKNFMFRTAQELARREGYKALVSGDSLAQVASQTLDNLVASDLGIELPLLRPVTAYDKEEIISLARRLGTYEDSIEDYKDCCSIIARRPSTAVKVEQLRGVLAALQPEPVLEKTLAEMGRFDLRRGVERKIPSPSEALES